MSSHTKDHDHGHEHTTFQKDIDDLSKEMNMSETEFDNYISENLSDENVIIQISTFISKNWNLLTNQIRIERGKNTGKAPEADSAEVEGSKILENRKEKTKKRQGEKERERHEAAPQAEQDQLDYC